MKIKYRKLDNVIVAMGPCDFAPDAECEVEEVNIEHPYEAVAGNYKRIPGGIEPRSKTDLDAETDAVIAERRSAKREVLNALATVSGIPKSKIIKGLKMALDDGNDD